MGYEIVNSIELLAYPYGEDCVGEWFSANTKFNLTKGKPVIYKHGAASYKGVIGEVLDYRKTSDGVVATVGLYSTPVLGRIQEGYQKGALFGSSGADEGKFKVSPDGEILEWDDHELTLIDVVSSGSMVPCNFRARATKMGNYKCNCSGSASMLMEVPTELVETIGEIMADNKAEEEVIENTDSGEDDASTEDNLKAAAEKKEEDTDDSNSGVVESVFTKRAEAAKQKSAEHKDVDDYLATLVASEIISADSVSKHREVFVSLKAAKNDSLIETYMDTLESGGKFKSSGQQKVKAPIHKTPLTKEKAAAVNNYDVEVQNLAAALEGYNAYTRA